MIVEKKFILNNVDQPRKRTAVLTGLLLLAASLVVSGCSSIGGGGGSGSPSSSAGSGYSNAKVGDLIVFGDSYSQPSYRGSAMWHSHLVGQGRASGRQVYAIGGAKAASGASIAFDQQISRFLGRGYQPGDLTVVYFGYNDIGRGNSDGFSSARAGYSSGIQRLIDAGAVSKGKRILVTQIHNWGRVPSRDISIGAQVRQWNSIVAGIANSHSNVVAVDLYSFFERVHQNPGSFGLVNVTDPSVAASGSNYLYLDGTHFGTKGQSLIASVYADYINRNIRAGQQVSAASSKMRTLQDDISQGLTGAMTTKPTQGFSAFAFGQDNKDTVASEWQTRGSEFATQDGEDQPNGGVALNFSKNGHFIDSHYGIAVSQYESVGLDMSAMTNGSMNLASNAFSVYWQNQLPWFSVMTQFSQMDNEFDVLAYDDILDFSVANVNQGSSWAFQNRIQSYSKWGNAEFSPWLTLTHLSHKLDDYTAKSLYTSDMQAEGGVMDETLASFGLQVNYDPIRLAQGRLLKLDASMRYLNRVRASDMHFSYREANMPGVVQQEIAKLNRLDVLDMQFNAALEMTQNLKLGALFGLNMSENNDNQQVNVNLSYQF